MVAGVVGFIFGVFVAWLPSRNQPRGFAIGITIGGVMQIFLVKARHIHLNKNVWFSVLIAL